MHSRGAFVKWIVRLVMSRDIYGVALQMAIESVVLRLPAERISS